ncbi:MAG: efflux RND transporter periplasmic adaptor subunit [Spirochaetaceae bacterium]|jgi:multidrug efflux pump subunit AcrA (membrane-fusion protein)|nr:efflux RND transporter periplasmic adaptor subunit [Spirochaetaceae bacterium]
MKKQKRGGHAQAIIVAVSILFIILIAHTLITRRGGGQGSTAAAPIQAGSRSPADGGGQRQAGGTPADGGGQRQAGGTPADGGGQRQAGGSPADGGGPPADSGGQRQTGGFPADGGGRRQAEGRMQGTAVRATSVELGSIENSIVVNGDVLAARQVAVYPAAGGKITRLPFRLGEAVRSGDIVAVIDPSRPGELYQTSPVRSTINGTILQIPFNIGDQVSATQAVAVVGDLSSLVVETYIPERFSTAMRMGLGADIAFDSLPGEFFPARISEISPIIDPSSRTLKIRLSFVKIDPRIKSGMFATLSLVTNARSNIPVLPREAVINTYGSWIVFVLDGASARRREIEIGMESETRIEVKSGLTAGEIVVVSGQNFLTDGDIVRVIQ